MERRGLPVNSTTVCGRYEETCVSEPVCKPAVRSSVTGITLLGSGCARGRELEDAVKAALSDLGMNATIGHIVDFARIFSFGVTSTPGLMIDGRVVSYGQILKKDDVVHILKAFRN
jgi:hypothetical protein